MFVVLDVYQIFTMHGETYLYPHPNRIPADHGIHKLDVKRKNSSNKILAFQTEVPLRSGQIILSAGRQNIPLATNHQPILLLNPWCLPNQQFLFFLTFILTRVKKWHQQKPLSNWSKKGRHDHDEKLKWWLWWLYISIMYLNIGMPYYQGECNIRGVWQYQKCS